MFLKLYTHLFLFLSFAKAFSFDPCDLSHIYDGNNFNYVIDKQVLEKCRQGDCFGWEIPYTREETELLDEDIRSLYYQVINNNVAKKKLAVITAGSPGTGKTTLMKQHLNEKNKRFAYICPDDVCLKGMQRTYVKDLQSNLMQLSLDDTLRDVIKVKQLAYDKWRSGSTIALHIILAHLIRQEYGFYFGATSSPPETADFFDFLKKRGYDIHLLHVTAPENMRWNAIKERDKAFVQTTEEDILKKGKLVPQRINDTYLKFADQIDFFYRQKIHDKAVLGAVWKKNPHDPRESKGVLEIVNSDIYKKIQQAHNAMCLSLGREDLLWNKVFASSKTKYLESSS